jgi:hypothetical protein
MHPPVAVEVKRATIAGWCNREANTSPGRGHGSNVL